MLNTKRTCTGRAKGLRARGRRGLALTGLLGLGLLTGCQPAQQTLTIGDLASRYNVAMWELSIVAIALSIIIFLGVSALLFYTVFRFREDKNPDEAQQFHGNDKLEVVLVGFPVVIVLLLSVLSVRTMAQTTPVVEENVGSEITALAKQFWWNFTYTDTESAAGGLVANGNEMIMPAGRSESGDPIDTKLTLQAGDVIHEFWAPNIGAQRQAIPGSEKVWTVHTDRPAVYQGNCNYLCGASHANMRYKVIALDPTDYATFISAAQNYVAPEPAPGSAEERGYNLFMNGKAETGAVACAACHRVQGTPANSPVGPDLSFFGTRRTLGAGLWEAPLEQGWDDPQANQHLINWLTNSPGVKPGSLMPPYDGSTYQVNGQEQKGGVLTAEEISDVAAYLKSLQLPEEANYWQKVERFNSESILPGGPQ